MSDENKYLCFRIGEEEFAIPLLQVKEVIAPPKTTPLPFSQKHYVGMMDLRGQVLSIIDLRIKLNITPVGEESEKAVVILDVGEILIGVVVDAINRVASLKESDISNAPAATSSVRTDFITNVYRCDDQLILMLDVAKVLGAEDMNNLKSAVKAA